MRMMKKMVRLTFMSLPLAIMPKTLVLQHFLLFVQQLAVNHVVITPPPPPPTHPPAGTTEKHPKRPKTQKNRG